MARMWLLLAAAGALPFGGAAAQEEAGRPLMRDGNGNVVTRGGLALDENGDFALRFTRAFDASGNIVLDENGDGVFLALDPAGDFEAASRTAARAGLVLSPAGKWVAPTPAEAMRAFRRPDDPDGGDPSDPVVSVLTRRFDDWPRAELDALADELVRIVIAELPPDGRRRPEWGGKAREAQSALYASGLPDLDREYGIPYEGAFDALLRIWEASHGDAPAGRRWDPMGALHSLYMLEPEGRGRELLYAEVAAAEVPTSVGNRQHTPWCAVVRPMYWRHNAPEHVRRQGKRAVVAYVLRLLDEELRGLSGNAEVFRKVCGADQVIVS